MNEDELTNLATLAKDSSYLMKILENVIDCHKCSYGVSFLAISSLFCRTCVLSGITEEDAIKIVKSSYELCESLKNEQDDEK